MRRECLHKNQTGQHCSTFNPPSWRESFHSVDKCLARLLFFLISNPIVHQIQNLPGKMSHKWREQLHKAHWFLLTPKKAMMLPQLETSICSSYSTHAAVHNQFSSFVEPRSYVHHPIDGFLLRSQQYVLSRASERRAKQSLLQRHSPNIIHRICPPQVTSRFLAVYIVVFATKKLTKSPSIDKSGRPSQSLISALPTSQPLQVDSYQQYENCAVLVSIRHTPAASQPSRSPCFQIANTCDLKQCSYALL